MNWLEPICKAGNVLLGASLMLGLAPSTGAVAAERPYHRPHYQCPPGYRHMAPSPYYMPPSQPGQPGQPGDARPDQDQPGQRQPGDQRPGDQQPGDQPPQPPDVQDQLQQPTDFAPSADSSRANPSPGMNTPQLGRLDQANRLNLFDNMAAAPQNKVWFGFQYSSGITTGIGSSSEFMSFVTSNFPDPLDQQDIFDEFSGFTAEQRQINYRVGAEVLLTCDASVAIQGQYFTNEVDESGFSDDWSNPQIMFKYVLARDCDTILSATLGLTPQTRIEQGDFNENTTKFYPGMLYYETLGPSLFTQGGFQFGIPVREDQITTFDWSVSLGYWLYRDCSLVCGNCCCNQGRITGIIPQVNLLGKHTVGDATRANAFGIPTTQTFDPGFGGPIFSGPLSLYTEPQDVLDLSVGTLIVIGCDIQVGVGYSFPVTDDDTRESEFLSYVNYLF